MNRSTLLSAALIAATITGVGTIATYAQSNAPQAGQEEMQKPGMMRTGWFGGGRDRDGEDGERGWGRHGGEGRHWGKRHGGRHGMMGGPRGEMFRSILTEVDADKDGAITQAEVDAFRQAKVAGADANSDGGLSIDEFDTVYRELTRSNMVRAFQRLDTDGDGTITKAEMDNRFGNIVKFMDRNDDGKLSKEDRGGRR